MTGWVSSRLRTETVRFFPCPRMGKAAAAGCRQTVGICRSTSDRGTVRFSDCLATLLENTGQVFLEVGPGRTLSQLVWQQQARPLAVLNSLGRDGEGSHDLDVLLKTYGHLWVLGCKLDLGHLATEEGRRRVSLPTYPFERHRYWIEPDSPTTARSEVRPHDDVLVKQPNLDDWFYLPAWTRSLPPKPASRPVGSPRDWLVFLDECGLGSDLIQQLGLSEPL
jgi:acyl transferase domain-containing protein